MPREGMPVEIKDVSCMECYAVQTMRMWAFG